GPIEMLKHAGLDNPVEACIGKRGFRDRALHQLTDPILVSGSLEVGSCEAEGVGRDVDATDPNSLLREPDQIGACAAAHFHKMKSSELVGLMSSAEIVRNRSN